MQRTRMDRSMVSWWEERLGCRRGLRFAFERARVSSVFFLFLLSCEGPLSPFKCPRFLQQNEDWSRNVPAMLVSYPFQSVPLSRSWRKRAVRLSSMEERSRMTEI
jgi:hypothetical protein